MSPEARRRVGLTVAILLAALAQIVYADAMTLHLGNLTAKPDFLTAAAILCAMFCDANGGAGVGFCAGLLHACFAAPPHGGFGSLIVSRALVGFAVGWLEERVFRDNAPLALILVASGTALAETLFFVIAPQRAVGHWARAMGLTTLYNTLLAIPLYLLVRRLVGAHRGEGR